MVFTGKPLVLPLLLSSLVVPLLDQWGRLGLGLWWRRWRWRRETASPRHVALAVF
jgi:hypothetical protein